MTVEVSLVMNMACTHGIVPLPGGHSACVLVERRKGVTRILDVVIESIPDAEARRWLQEQEALQREA